MNTKRWQRRMSGLTDIYDVLDLMVGSWDYTKDMPVKGSIESLLDPLITAEKFKEVVTYSKVRGNPELPFVGVMQDSAKRTEESLGGRETWQVRVKIFSRVRDTEYPRRGIQTAKLICQSVWETLAQSRQLGLTQFVRDVEQDEIDVVPYPFGKDKTLCGAGFIITATVLVDKND